MWKLAAVALTALLALLALNWAPASTTAGPVFVINTLDDDPDDNLGDGLCETADPGECSLRAAIEQANDNGAGVAVFGPMFNSPVFDIIEIDSSGQGELPMITVPFTLDATDRYAVITNAEGSMVDYGLFILDDTPLDPTDVSIGVGGTIEFRGFEDTAANDDAEGDAIVVCGDDGIGGGCGSGPVVNVTISDLNVSDGVGGSVVDASGADGSSLTFEENDHVAGGAEPGLDITFGSNSTIDILNNRNIAGADGLNLEVGDDSSITVLEADDIDGDDDAITIDIGDNSSVDIDRNTNFDAAAGDGVAIEGGAGAVIDITDNGDIDGADNAIELTLGDNATAFLDDNGDLTGVGDPAVQAEIGSDATATVSQHDIISTGENAAIEFTTGDNSDVTVELNNEVNGADEGIVVEGGDGISVSISGQASIVGADDDGIAVQGTGVTVNIDDNMEVRGAAGDGIDIKDDLAGGTITGNTLIVGEDGPGIDLEADVEGGVLDGLLIDGNAIFGSSEQGIVLTCDTANGCAGGAGVTISNNTVSDSGLAGVAVEGEGFLGGVTVQGNAISGNGGPGVYILDSSDNAVLENTITMNGNTTTGVVVEEDAAEAKRNTISRNSMEANDGLGIDLGANGVTPNDGGDGDDGPNGLLNFPEGLAYNAGPQTVTGTACVGCTVEVFVTDDPPDSSDHGEGQTYLGDAVADGSGNFSVDVSGAPCGLGADLTATATDSDGNTSEFAENVAWPGSTACPTPTSPATPTPTATPPGGNEGDGDVNKDGVANALDAALILQHVAGLLPDLQNPERADVNLDGEVDALDALLILQFSAGLIDDLPV